MTGLVRSKECMQMLVTRPRNYSLNWLRIVDAGMFIWFWNPGRSTVGAEIEADAVAFFSWICGNRERVLLIYLGAIPSFFAEHFNSRALFQQNGFDRYTSGAHIDALFQQVWFKWSTIAVLSAIEYRLFAVASNNRTWLIIEDDTANRVHPLEGTRVLHTTEFSWEGHIVAFVLLIGII